MIKKTHTHISTREQTTHYSSAENRRVNIASYRELGGGHCCTSIYMNAAATASTTALAANATEDAPEGGAVVAGAVVFSGSMTSSSKLEPLPEPTAEDSSIEVSLPEEEAFEAELEVDLALPAEPLLEEAVAGAGVLASVEGVGVLDSGAGVVVVDGVFVVGAGVVVAGAGVAAALAQNASIGLVNPDSKATPRATQSPSPRALRVANAAWHAVLPQTLVSTASPGRVGGERPVSEPHFNTLGSCKRGATLVRSQSTALATAREAAASTRKDFIGLEDEVEELGYAR